MDGVCEFDNRLEEKHHSSLSFETTLCDICRVKDNSSPRPAALYHCTDCKKGLCQVCKDTHQGLALTSQHSVLELCTIKVGDESDSRVLQVQCKEHREGVSSYCRHHDRLLCVVCLHVMHRKCTSVEDIQAYRFNGKDSYSIRAKYLLLLGLIMENLRHLISFNKTIEGMECHTGGTFTASFLDEVVNFSALSKEMLNSALLDLEKFLRNDNDQLDVVFTRHEYTLCNLLQQWDHLTTRFHSKTLSNKDYEIHMFCFFLIMFSYMSLMFIELYGL